MTLVRCWKKKCCVLKKRFLSALEMNEIELALPT